MSDLEEVLGAIVAAVARARVLADEETIAIAEEYRQHPLLRGMTVPRVRLPDVTIDLPVVIDGHDAGGKGEPEAPTNVRSAVSEELKSAVADLGLTVPRGMITAINTSFDEQLAGRKPKATQARDVYAAAAGDALLALARDPRFAKAFSKEQLGSIQSRLRQRARDTAVKVVPTEGRLQVNVATAAVKNETDPANVTRIRISLREEGLEWAMYEREDGTEGRALNPE